MLTPAQSQGRQGRQERQDPVRAPPARRCGVLLAVCVLSCWPHLGRASSGDRSWAFQACLYTCTAGGCARWPLDTPAPGRLVHTVCPETCTRDGVAVPLSLRIFRWSCSDDCKYHCMHASEAWKRGSTTGRQPPAVEKYYGKWAFLRVMGMQELASVLASLANLAVHVLCLRRLRASVLRPPPGPPAAHPGPTDLGAPRPAYPFLALWTLCSALHINAWLWSAVFHSRDTRLTERLDYCSAITLVAMGLLAVLVRALWGPRRGRRLLTVAAAAAVVAGLVLHLRYMLLIKFDYGWNMAVCVAAGVCTAALWLVWCSWTRHPAARTMWVFLLLLHACMLLELADFPPLGGLVDAHAAWHVATVPLTPLFYSWLRADAAMLEGKSKRTRSHHE